MIPVPQSQFTFGSQFLDTYATRILGDPRTALTELVANAWDAGALNVEISWPSNGVGSFSIQDDGIGMTESEQYRKWQELAYNRRKEHGDEVVFPAGVDAPKRRVYGRNGKGRHAMFCFSNEYLLETWRDGFKAQCSVSRSEGDAPFRLGELLIESREGHGTRLAAELAKHHLNASQVQEHLGSRFVSDPSFRVAVNGKALELSSRAGESRICQTLHGDARVYLVDSTHSSSRSDFHGIAWWVNRRLVGIPHWLSADGDPLLDRRTTSGKRFTFIVEADMLEDHVQDDWSGFKDDDFVRDVRLRVEQFILDWYHELSREDRRQAKRSALKSGIDRLRPLSKVARQDIGHFVDELQRRVPSVSSDVLEATIDVLSTMEASRSRFSLLDQMARLSSSDLDDLDSLLRSWSVAEIREIVRELENRIAVIRQLESLVGQRADELRVVQPLFEQALWIFGPEYDGIEYQANRQLSTVLRKLLSDNATTPREPKKRPDIAARIDSFGLYSCADYARDGEISGIKKVIIVELKKGQSRITVADTQQAEGYAREILRSGHVSPKTKAICWVLGDSIDDDAAEDLMRGNTIEVRARPFSLLLQIADKRIFNLRQRIDAIAPGAPFEDHDVEQVVAEQLDLSPAFR